MKKLGLAALFCCAIATACGDGAPSEPTAPPQVHWNPSPPPGCPGSDALEAMVKALFPRGDGRVAVTVRLAVVIRMASANPGGRYHPDPQTHALRLIQFILDRYEADRLIGGHSPATQATLQRLLNGILCVVGLPPAFGDGALGPDGAVAIIEPTSPDTTVVTETEWAGMHIPTGSVTQPTIVTIQRLPDAPGPLLTQFDQYPIYYEFSSSPAVPFSADLVVGVCLADNATPPDPSRLRVAHNIPPYTMGSIEVLPLAPASFLDCSDAPIASTPTRWGFDLARAGSLLARGIAAVLAPRPLMASPFGVGGVGGTVRTFSPFGVIDTLAVVSYASQQEFHGPFGGPADGLPAVFVMTPTQRPMPGISVTFAITDGGSSLTGGSATTDASGKATVGSWTLRDVNVMSATASSPTPGTGFLGNPRVFVGYDH